jgi:hypothetical protein
MVTGQDDRQITESAASEEASRRELPKLLLTDETPALHLPLTATL